MQSVNTAHGKFVKPTVLSSLATSGGFLAVVSWLVPNLPINSYHHQAVMDKLILPKYIKMVNSGDGYHTG